MSNEVNQAYLRAYVKSRAEGAPVRSRQPAAGSSPATEPVRKPITQRIDSGTQQVPAPNLSVSSRSPSVAPPQKEMLRQEATKPIEPPQQSNVWSPLGVERGIKATGVFRSQPAVVVNGSNANRQVLHVSESAPRVYEPKPESESVTRPGRTSSQPVERPTQAEDSSVPRFRIDRAHTRTTTDGNRSEVPASSTVADVTPKPKAIQSVAPQGYNPDPTQHRRLDPAREAFAQRNPPVSQSRAPDARTPLPLPVTFSASWEVDRFFWPEVAIQIEKSHGDAFQQIGKHLRLANQEGLKVMAVTSGERGVGRSTVAIHLARCAAAAGLSVALVDSDTFYPSLVDQLRLDIEHGWQDCLFENVPLEEVAVRSIEDRITVFPLTSVVSAQQLHANLHRMSKTVKRIASAFDIVLLDSNRLNLEQRELVGVSQETIVDAAIVVVDTELSIKEKVDTAVSILQGMGITSVGIVENFNG
jgi:Mrp family chromosome partitioning ATPase